jgi:hypothetical protein
MNIRFSTWVVLLTAAVVLGATWWAASARRLAEPADDPPVANAAMDGGATAAAAEPAAPPRRSKLSEEILGRLRDAALQHEDPAAREAFLQKAVRGVPRALYARLAESLRDAVPHSVEAEILRAVLLRWAWEEPTNAADWAVEQTDHPYRKEALAVAAQAWARLDPAQLLLWAADLPASDREWVLLRSGDYLGRTDPSLFAVWQQALPPGRESEQLQLAIAREWAQRDPEVLVAALTENTGPEFEEWRRLTIAGLTTRLTTMSGPDAARFALERIPPGPAQAQAVLGAVAAWAREDPATASQWVDRFPDEELRAQAARVLLGRWLQQDAIAAQTYARSLPPGPTADAAIEQVAQFIALQEGLDAAAWAERITDPERRDRARAFVLSESSIEATATAGAEE